MKVGIPWAFGVLLACALFVLPVSAKATEHDATVQNVETLSGELDALIQHLAETEQSSDSLKVLRAEIDSLQRKITSISAEIRDSLGGLAEKLDALGPAPPADAPPEPASVTEERTRLEEQRARLEGVHKAAELLSQRANEKSLEIAQDRRRRFVNDVFSRTALPVAPDVIVPASSYLAEAVATTGAEAWNWLTQGDAVRDLKSAGVPFALVLVLCVVMLWPLRRYLSRKFGRDPGIVEPDVADKFRAGLALALIRSVLPTLAVVAVYLVLRYQELLTGELAALAEALLLSLVLFIVITAFVRGMLATRHPAWRVAQLDDVGARSLKRIIAVTAAVVAFDYFMRVAIDLFPTYLELVIVYNFVMTTVISGVLIFVLINRRLWKQRDLSRGGPLWVRLRFVGAGLLFAIPILSLVGYVSLGRFLSTQIVQSGGLIVFLLFLSWQARELCEYLTSSGSVAGAYLRRNLDLSDKGAEILAYWSRVAINTILLCLGGLGIAWLWGADQSDLLYWGHRLAFGVQIGQFNIGLIDILTAIIVFAVVVVVTRLFQRLLERRVLPRTRLDIGVRQSIKAGIGYLGFILAILAGISTVGLDLSNIAIVAGALSVGIGFGLQNIVNNFVSGLILLIERPIKAGDWVVVGATQGYVKKINVRATEITTFDRASVFIPNSTLISEQVTNWTHADKIGRVIIPIGVAYGSNTEKVRDVLMTCARNYPDVLSSPPPYVLFRGFGDSSLNFELRAYIGNVEEVLTISSDLCFAIDEAFREHGIEIPFPQRDLHIKGPVFTEAAPGSESSSAGS